LFSISVLYNTRHHLPSHKHIAASPQTIMTTHNNGLAALPDIAPGIYRHYKGMDYEVIAVARHSETMEAVVVYRALYGEFGLWVRPAAMFMETVQVDGQAQLRFTPVSPA
jgi:hypothetical protein